MTLLAVRNLDVAFATPTGTLRALDGVSFQLDRGDSLGLVGESGSGKSTTAYALMRLLPPNGAATGGVALLDGEDLLRMPDAALRAARWSRIAMVFQNAMTAMNPVMRIGDQLVGALQQHRPMRRAEARALARAMFARVGLPPARLMQYPHEFSGGMKQRAVMALALICEPAVLLADEPTTALDVVAQRQVLQLLGRLQQEFGLALILISHDIAAVAETCARVAVMYAGQVIEQGPTRAVFRSPAHPYTRALVAAVPSLHARALASIEGTAPDLRTPSPGCRFAPRCPNVAALCRDTAPPVVDLADGRTARCHFAARCAA
jgi:oligopeptide/dipeptide ABC transporter ATP-binding protein